MIVVPEKRREIAIIGMPRSGSTIVASYINSFDRAFILGEPHLAANSPRPMGKSWSAIVDTPFDAQIILVPGKDPYPIIIEFADTFDLLTVGFKECWTPWTNPVDIVSGMLERLDSVIVTVRDPRTNYASIRERTKPGYPPLYSSTFNREYARLCDFVDNEPKARPVFLSFFREFPEESIKYATKWTLHGEHEFKQFAGGGDEGAAASRSIKHKDRRQPYMGRDIVQSVDRYEKLVSDHGDLLAYIGRSGK